MIEYIAAFGAGMGVTILASRDYIKRILPNMLADKAQVHFDEWRDSVTPESLLPTMTERNIELIDKRIEIFQRCGSHFEDLQLAYDTHNETQIQHCRERLQATIGEAQATPKPTFVPNTRICEAHAAVHAGEEIVAQMNQMEVHYRMSRGLGGGFQG